MLIGKIALIMEDEATMESILRTLREMLATEPKDAPDPQPMPEEIERTIRE